MTKRILLVCVWGAVAGSMAAGGDPEPLGDRTIDTNVLGYDPKIQVLPETRLYDVQRTDWPTVYLHGFGANGDAADYIKRSRPQNLPGHVVTYDFPDAVRGSGGMNTSASSLGQWPDAKTPLYILGKLSDRGYKQVGLNGHSRGGATAVNLVAILQNKTGTYDAKLASIGIDHRKRAQIVAMLQSGHIVLECPLTEVPAVLQHQIKQGGSAVVQATGLAALLSSLVSWIPKSVTSISASVSSATLDVSTYASAATANVAAPAVLGQYSPVTGEQALHSAGLWNSAQIPTMVHFQNPDEVLGNKNDSAFIAALRKGNGDDYTHYHIGNDGGHNSSFASFARPRNDFLRKAGASYHRGYVTSLSGSNSSSSSSS